MEFKDILAFNKPYNEKNIKELIEDIRKNNVVPYIGSGCSHLFDDIYPLWNTFLTQTFDIYCNQKEKKNFSSLSYEEKADYLYKEIGTKSFSNYLEYIFGEEHLNGKKKINFIDKPIYFLPKIFKSGLLMTTNYDNVIEKIYGIYNKHIKAVYPEQTEALNRALTKKELLLFKIHGDIMEPESSIIITKEQYDKAYSDPKLVSSLVKIYQRKVILFLGCSLLSDRPLEELQKVTEPGMLNYTIIPSSKSQIRSRRLTLENEYSIKSIIYPEGKHECLKILLQYISEQISSQYQRQDLDLVNSKKLIKNIPEPKVSFFGREEIFKQIDEKLKKCNILYLYGIGGIGKSELVKKYINNRKEKYDGIVFTVYDGSIKSTFINDIIISNNQFYGNSLEDNYRQWKITISSLNIKRTLIIIDNVENKDEDFNKEINFLAGIGFKIIITTRVGNQREYNNIFIGPESEGKLFRFFVDMADLNINNLIPEDKKYIYKILNLFQYHTMAIELSALQYQNGFDDLKTYFKNLERGISGVSNKVFFRKDYENEDFQTAYYFIDTLFDLSKLNKEEIKILKLLCLIPIDGIEGNKLLEVLAFSKFHENHINKLIYLGLIHKDKNKIHLHPLLKEIVLTRHRPSILEENQKKYIEFIFENIEKNEVDYQNVVPYINLLLEFSKKISRLLDTEKNDIYLKLFKKLYYYGFYELAQKIAIQGEGKYKKGYSENHTYLIRSYLNRGSVLEIKGELDDALRYYKSAMIAKELHPNIENIYISQIYIDIGNIYYRKKELERALEYYYKALNIEKKKHRKPDGTVATIYNNIGLAYGAKGDLIKALKYLKDSLEIRKVLYGEKHKTIIRSKNNISNVYYKKGNIGMALNYVQSAIKLAKEIYGEKHLDIATGYDLIGDVYATKGNLEIALKYYKKAFNIRKNLFSEKNPTWGRSYSNMGFLYRLKEEPDEALKYYKDGLTIYLEFYGEKNPNLLSIYKGMGIVYVKKGELETAITYHKKAANIARAFYGVNNGSLASSYNSMGEIYARKKNFKIAIEYCEKGLAINKYLGSRRAVAKSYNSIGNIYAEKGDFRKALRYCKKSLNIRKNLLGEFHADTGGSYSNIGNIYLRQKKFELALRYYEYALNAKKKFFGEKHITVANTYAWIGSTYYRKGEFILARKYYQKGLEIQQYLYGDNHCSAAISYNNIGRTYYMERKVEAINCFQKASKIYGKFGKRYLNEINTINELIRKFNSNTN